MHHGSFLDLRDKVVQYLSEAHSTKVEQLTSQFANSTKLYKQDSLATLVEDCGALDRMTVAVLQLPQEVQEQEIQRMARSAEQEASMKEEGMSIATSIDTLLSTYRDTDARRSSCQACFDTIKHLTGNDLLMLQGMLDSAPPDACSRASQTQLTPQSLDQFYNTILGDKTSDEDQRDKVKRHFTDTIVALYSAVQVLTQKCIADGTMIPECDIMPSATLSDEDVITVLDSNAAQMRILGSIIACSTGKRINQTLDSALYTLSQVVQSPKLHRNPH